MTSDFISDANAREQTALRLAALNAELEQRTVELHARTIQLSGIVESAMDAIVSVDHDQRVVLFNGAAERMFGWTANQIIGQPLERLIPTSVRAAHQAHLGQFDGARTKPHWMGQPHPIAGQTLINEWAVAAPACVAKGREISTHVRNVIEHARELARGLSPNLHFEPGGLMAALQELADRTERVFQRNCRFTCAGTTPVRDKATSIHLYRIAQEAVGNALKHSKATRIDLRLESTDRAVVLRIDDNGIGIPIPPAAGNGAGLRIMRYRASLMGGVLAVERAAGGGTAIVCTVHDIIGASL